MASPLTGSGAERGPDRKWASHLPFPRFSVRDFPSWGVPSAQVSLPSLYDGKSSDPPGVPSSHPFSLLASILWPPWALVYLLPSLVTRGSLNQHSSLFVTVSSSFSPASLGASRAKTSPVHFCDPPSPQHGLARRMGGQYPGYVCG